MATKIIKCLKINITKEVKDLYIKYDKITVQEVKERKLGVRISEQSEF